MRSARQLPALFMCLFSFLPSVLAQEAQSAATISKEVTIVAGARIGGSGASVVAQVQPPLCLLTPSGCHDASLTGEGTIASPLGIANGGVTGPKIAAGQVVKSLNGLFDPALEIDERTTADVV